MAQAQRESCKSMTSKTCFTSHAELKTDRELGIGIGQLTITKTMNVFEEVKKKDPVLKTWQWDDRYNLGMQTRALVLMDMLAYKNYATSSNSIIDAIAFMGSEYNGGRGGVLKDKALCGRTKTFHCDPSKWFGNVEKVSLKAKTAVKGYGQSFFDVNRGYARWLACEGPIRYSTVVKDSEPLPVCPAKI